MPPQHRKKFGKQDKQLCLQRGLYRIHERSMTYLSSWNWLRLGQSVQVDFFTHILFKILVNSALKDEVVRGQSLSRSHAKSPTRSTLLMSGLLCRRKISPSANSEELISRSESMRLLVVHRSSNNKTHRAVEKNSYSFEDLLDR
ncbi:hypothetical protein LguiB_003582 [Lonicera macranthoides]